MSHRFNSGMTFYLCLIGNFISGFCQFHLDRSHLFDGVKCACLDFTDGCDHFLTIVRILKYCDKTAIYGYCFSWHLTTTNNQNSNKQLFVDVVKIGHFENEIGYYRTKNSRIISFKTNHNSCFAQIHCKTLNELLKKTGLYLNCLDVPLAGA